MAEKTDREWIEFCRPFVFMNGSHEMPNYPALCRAVAAISAPPPAGAQQAVADSPSGLTDGEISVVQKDLADRNWDVSRLHISMVAEAVRRLYPNWGVVSEGDHWRSVLQFAEKGKALLEKVPADIAGNGYVYDAAERLAWIAIKARDALAASAAAQETPITSSIMIDKGGESPVYCLMAAYRSEQGASNALRLISTPASALAATPAPEAAPSAKEGEAVRALVAEHARLIEQGNNYAYFELAYTRQTGWMAWITDKPLTGGPVVNPDRKVLFRGQGDSPEEACRDALKGLTPAGGDR